MVTKPKTMKFNSLKYDQIQSCSILYNFIFDPKSNLIEINKKGLDTLITEIMKKHKNLALFCQ